MCGPSRGGLSQAISGLSMSNLAKSNLERRAFLALTVLGLPLLNACRSAHAASSRYDSTIPDLQFPGLKSPFDVASARAALGTPATDLDCEKPPTPVIVLDHESKYEAGTNSSIVDPDKDEAYQDKLKKVSTFYNPLVRISDRYVKSQPRASEIAICAAQWLEQWAQAGAMEEGVTEQGRMVQAWALASVATTYLKIRQDPYISQASRKMIVDWLNRLKGLVVANFNSRTSEVSRSNNHRYWANWAVGATAIVLNDPEAFEWAGQGFGRACQQIGADGVLPLEMARRSKALHYHNFSLSPLVLQAEALIANGDATPYTRNNGAIHRLVDLVLTGLENPQVFVEQAGEVQDLDGTLKDTQLAWMEPYFARFGDERLKPWLKSYRPMVAHRLGGDLTFLFAKDAVVS